MTAISDNSVISSNALLTRNEKTTFVSCDKMTGSENNYIKYSNVYNDNTDVYYHTTYTGYKELLIIEKPSDINEYQFVLNTGGLIPEIADNGEIILSDNETDEIVGSFANLYVYDSSETIQYTLDNYYTITPLDKDQYIVTVVVDDSFLKAKTTVYPVIVDPTFSFNTSAAIHDAPVYSGVPTVANGSNYYNHIGYVDDNYKVGYLLVKFPALKNSTFFNNLTDSRISSVTYNVKKVGGNTSYTSTLKAYNYIGSAWSNSTVTYNSAAVSSNTGTNICSVDMKADGWYSFNITSAAKAWKNGTASYDKGIVIKNTTNNTNANCDRVLASVEYANNVDSSCMPYITVVFNNSSTSSGYTSADAAAYAFAQSVYSASEFTRFEYGATIFKSGNLYYYQNVHVGKPHYVTISVAVPGGTTFIGYIHTHLISESFSEADIEIADRRECYAYVVTPSHDVKRYSTSEGTTTIATGVLIYPLTETEKDTLEDTLRSEWESHLTDGSCINVTKCQNKTWPNE